MQKSITLHNRVGLVLDTDSIMFGVQLLRNLPGTLLTIGTGFFQLEIVLVIK